MSRTHWMELLDEGDGVGARGRLSDIDPELDPELDADVCPEVYFASDGTVSATLGAGGEEIGKLSKANMRRLGERLIELSRRPRRATK